MAPRYSREWLDYFIPDTVDWHPDGMPDTSRAVMKSLVLRSEKWPHGIPDADLLHRTEGVISYMRMQELADDPIPGRFDLPHFQRIHHHLFQDIYPWAGQLRTAPRDWPMVKMGPDVAAVRNVSAGAPKSRIRTSRPATSPRPAPWFSIASPPRTTSADSDENSSSTS